MGCDIHFRVEVKTAGVWKSADKWVQEEWGMCVNEEFYDGRNYDLFAILADVRNGHGFAGVKTSEGFNVIDQPRGLPDDISPEVKEDSDGWSGDGHSHSWFTVAELKAFDWTQKTQHQGWVGLDEFKVYLQRGKPNSWSGGVGGGGVVHLSIEEMTEVVTGKRLVPDGKGVYTQVSWTETYADSVRYFLEETIPKMEAIGEPDNVRAVFWFDN